MASLVKLDHLNGENGKKNLKLSLQFMRGKETGQKTFITFFWRCEYWIGRRNI